MPESILTQQIVGIFLKKNFFLEEELLLSGTYTNSETANT
jgi:hypothetical protein